MHIYKTLYALFLQYALSFKLQGEFTYLHLAVKC